MHSSMRWLHQAALCLILLGGHALADGGVSAAVQVKGLVSQPATFGPADLARMEVREVMLGSGNAPPRGYRGVLLCPMRKAGSPWSPLATSAAGPVMCGGSNRSTCVAHCPERCRAK